MISATVSARPNYLSAPITQQAINIDRRYFHEPEFGLIQGENRLAAAA
jgi:hypothetical protein